MGVVDIFFQILREFPKFYPKYCRYVSMRKITLGRGESDPISFAYLFTVNIFISLERFKVNHPFCKSYNNSSTTFYNLYESLILNIDNIKTSRFLCCDMTAITYFNKLSYTYLAFWVSKTKQNNNSNFKSHMWIHDVWNFKTPIFYYMT